jgi:predicted GNAT family N-acyltransferase
MALTTAAAIGLTLTAATSGASFIQAGNQKRLQRQAEAEAEKAMAEARKGLEVNTYEQLGINKEIYETERESQLVAAAQIIEAARESDRGAEATAGRVLLASQEAQKDITKRMAQEQQAIDVAIATEQSRLRDIGVQLSLEEVAGAQLAAAQSQEMAGQAMQQGLQGIASLGQQVAAAVPLYPQQKSASIKPGIGVTTPVSQEQLASNVFARAATPSYQQLAGPSSLGPSFGTSISPSLVSPYPSTMPMGGISPLAGVGVPQQLPMAGGYIDWSQLLRYK